jgi:predicted RNase H-like HicB family nuclease
MFEVLEYVKNYTYLVRFSWEDEAYLAECLELGIIAHGDTHEEAIKEIKEATKQYLLMLREDNEEIPQPEKNLQRT